MPKPCASARNCSRLSCCSRPLEQLRNRRRIPRGTRTGDVAPRRQSRRQAVAGRGKRVARPRDRSPGKVERASVCVRDDLHHVGAEELGRVVQRVAGGGNGAVSPLRQGPPHAAHDGRRHQRFVALDVDDDSVVRQSEVLDGLGEGDLFRSRDRRASAAPRRMCGTGIDDLGAVGRHGDRSAPLAAAARATRTTIGTPDVGQGLRGSRVEARRAGTMTTKRVTRIGCRLASATDLGRSHLAGVGLEHHGDAVADG